MKSVINRVLVAFLLVTLAGTAAFAKTKMGRVSFMSAIKVNGTLVKKGDYDVTFDEMTGEVSFEKNGKVIAKAAARLERRSRKAGGTAFETRQAEMGMELVSIAFSGSDQNVVLTQMGMQAGRN
jgi:hypothetical protein